MQNNVTALLGQKLPIPVQGALQRVLLLDRMMEMYAQIQQMPGDRSFSEKLLTCLEVEPRISPLDFSRIPKEGPVVVVANHPFGLIEAAILAAILPTIRPDVKIMSNFVVSTFTEVRDLCIFVDPFGGQESVKANQKGIRDCIQCLRQGGMLVVFPAGEVAHLDLRQRQITDPPWSEMIARLARIGRASVLPMYFRGSNSALFHILGAIHPRFRTAMLPHEFLNKQHTAIELRVGNPIGLKKLQSFADDASLIRYLRHRTYLLEGRESYAKPTPGKLAFLRRRTHKTALQPVIAAVDAEVLAAEVGSLAKEHFLAESGDLTAVLARAHEVPACLREIGRLRELTFRQTGEGTGKSIDLDEFDAYYRHLFIWNKETREVVGAYRLGASDEILNRFGTKGLYTNTLFAYKRAFVDRIGPALEMGRSFVRAEYQKNYAPLLLLWKGIGKFVARSPRYKVLFGPVSISNEYNPASRQLIVKFLETYSQCEDLAKLVRARSPFRTRPLRVLEDLNEDLNGAAVWDIEELSALIADIETDQKGVPVLLKQYLKLGGKLLAFNLDSHFADALDGLIVVDLTQTDARVLERYMGKEGAAGFMGYHRCGQDSRVSA